VRHAQKVHRRSYGPFESSSCTKMELQAAPVDGAATALADPSTSAGDATVAPLQFFVLGVTCDGFRIWFNVPANVLQK
jgi:hypothetical protein